MPIFHSISCTFMLNQRRLDPGKETLEGFFQVVNHKEYQNVVMISFVHLEKLKKIFYAQECSARPLEN